MVFTMIPARNKEEYDLFPSEDSEFVKRWLTFTDDNVKYLRNTMPIPTLGSPSLSGVDGTAAMYEDEGYLFLFNPSYVDMPVRVVREVRLICFNLSIHRHSNNTGTTCCGREYRSLIFYIFMVCDETVSWYK